MKKLFLSFIVSCLVLLQLVAQEPVFVKGDKVFNLGIGVGAPIFSIAYNQALVPPVSGSMEIGIVDKVLEKGVVGVGPYVGFLSYRWRFSNYSARYSNTIIGVRGNFHYPLIDKLDTYTGLLLGYKIVKVTETGDPYNNYADTSSQISWAWFIGGRYYFKENFAAMLELGYGVAYLNLGVALKF